MTHNSPAPKNIGEAARALIAQWLALPEEKRGSNQRARESALDGLWRQFHQLRAAVEAEDGVDAPERQSYARTRTEGLGHDRETTERHESYGMIQLTRSHGGGRHFGSQIEHGTSFHFIVSRGERQTSSWGERFRAQGRGADIVDFTMTPAQFVDLIGAVGVGGGVPCTLRRVMGVPMDPVPLDAGSEMETAHDELLEAMKQVIERVRGLERELDGTFAKLTKKDREAAMATVVKLRRFVDDELPFAAKLFGEHKEHAVAKGRAEIDAFIGLALRHAGIKAIRDAGGVLQLSAETPKALPGSEE